MLSICFQRRLVGSWNEILMLDLMLWMVRSDIRLSAVASQIKILRDNLVSLDRYPISGLMCWQLFCFYLISRYFEPHWCRSI